MPETVYKTGRQRTIIISGQITGRTGMLLTCGPNPNPPPDEVKTDLFHRYSKVSVGWLSFTLTGWWNINPNQTSPYCNQIDVYRQSHVQITTAGPFDFVAGSGTASDHESVFLGQPREADWQVTGDYSISVNATELIEIFEEGAYVPADAPAYTKVRVYEALLPAGEVEIEIRGGGRRAWGKWRLSPSVPGPLLLSTDVFLQSIAFISTFKNTSSYSNTTSITANYAGTSMSSPYEETLTYGNTTAQFSGSSGASVSVNGRQSATLNNTIYLSRSFSLDGVVRAMDVSYPDALEVLIQSHKEETSPGNWTPVETPVSVVNGSFSFSRAQAMFTTQGMFVGGDEIPIFYGPTVTKKEMCEVKARINPDSLSSQHEDHGLTRLLLRGSRFNAMTLRQDASVTIDNGSTLTPASPWAGEWSATGGATVTAGSGYLHLVFGPGPGATGTVTRSFAPDVTLATYRFLRLRARTAGRQPFAVQIGNKTWKATTCDTTEWHDVDIDLCAEWNATVAASDFDSQWPLDANGLPLNEGPFFGVGRCAALVLSGMPANAYLDVDSVTLVRKAGSSVSFLPSYRAPERRFLLGNTDGRQSLEESDMASPSSQYPRSIAELIAGVTAQNGNGVLLNPGWQATDLKPYVAGNCSVSPPSFNDCYLTSARDAVFLYGGGAYWDGTTWQYGFDRPMDATQTVPAQMLFDEVTDWRPGCGDIFGHNPPNPNSATLVLKAAAILRSQAHGIVIEQTAEGDVGPATGVAVTLTDITDPVNETIAGSGGANGMGFFKTGSPFLRGGLWNVPPPTQRVGEAEPDGGYLPRPTAQANFYARKRHRFSFKVALRCTSMLPGLPSTFFPFPSQFSDMNVLPLEAWRRIPASEDVTRSDSPGEDATAVGVNVLAGGSNKPEK